MANFENRLVRRKGKHGGDLYRLDTKNKTPDENIKEIIQGLYLKKPFQSDASPSNKNVALELKPDMRPMPRCGSDSYRLSYLNGLVMLLCKEDRNNLGFTSDELMTCIRVSLVDDSMVIRAAALRVIRYLIKTESDVATFNILKLPYLVIRSMDLMLRNEEERAQALRVVRRIIAVVGPRDQPLRRHRSAYIDKGLLRCLVAVACSGSEGDGSGDRLSRPAIATLAEICVLNPDLFISCGGVTAVTRQLAVCATPRMAEALCGVLLHTLNDPASRIAARIDLTCLNSPYCDFHVRPAGTDSSRDEREMRFTCSRLALLCVLRSWPGLLHFCHPCSTGGLRALVRALSLPRLEVRKAILDLLYELVGLPQPEWTDEISVALDAVDPSDFQDSWRLNEGFVAAEGVAILPHLSATGPDIMEIHLALLLQCFLEAGLLDGLAEVIVTSDTFISVRATVLLGQLLHLIHLFLPPQICNITPALPSLISQASEGKPQALAAVAALRRLHSMFEARPATNSLFLDHIVQYCSGAFKIKVEDTSKSRKEKDNANMAKPKTSPDFMLDKDKSLEFLDESDTEPELKQRHSVGSRADVPTRNVSALVKSKSVTSRTSAAVSRVFSLFERDSENLLRSTLVMQNKDGNTWNWEIIRTVLKETDGLPLLNLNDSGHKAWAGRIINYLKPSSNKYSHTDLSSTCHGHSATRAGCQLIRHLLRHNDADSQKLLEDLFNDVSTQIKAIETGRKAHECLFSPQHMCNTMCQMYFLFIGQLCHSQAGLRLFKQTKLYENLLELSTKTHHSCYVKLVISSLEYTIDASPRDILGKTLTCGIQASRLYATQFLNVLLRASRKSRELVRKKSKLKKNILQEHWRFYQKDDGEVASSMDMDSWILQILIGQVKDESKVVAKCALSILEEAYSVPVFLEKMITMKDALARNCKLDKNADPSTFDFSVVGDRGYLLWLCLEVAASGQTPDSQCISFLRKHLAFWAKFYNYRYVRLVEAGVHEALTLSEGVRRPRAHRRSARPPPHLHAALAALAAHTAHAAHASPHPARALLTAALPPYFRVLQRKKCTTDQEMAELKASLWAIGNTAVTSQGLQLLMNLSNGFVEDSAPSHIVRLAKYSPVYSVRATAFYVLCLIGSTFDGANLLADLGWLCVRHTRHDQFPVIPDENYLQIFDPNETNYHVTSPDRRYNAFDMDLSEHSDHTDLSAAESLHSENIRVLNRTMGSVSEKGDTKDQDMVDHRIGYRSDGRRETDKRKSHTLPSQGCASSLERSALTESRTVDILRDCFNYERPGTHKMHMENRLLLGRMNSLDNAHEGRVRNTSESSTSGVSSCDSFMGKYAIPDRVLTLSPIPSSSSLYGMKSSTSSQRPKFSESHRRISSSSFTTPDVASSPPTQMDMSGYATLKSLNRNRRPHLSESAATGSSDIDDLSWLLSDSSRRSKPFSSLRDRAKSTRERLTKMSLLEYDWKPLVGGEGTEATRGSGRPPRLQSSTQTQQYVQQAPLHVMTSKAPVYIGICLPRDLKDLFPRDESAVDGEEVNPSAAYSAAGAHSTAMESSAVDYKARVTPEHHAADKWMNVDPLYGTSMGANVRRVLAGNVVATSGIIITTSAVIATKPDVTSEASAVTADKTGSNNTSTSLSVKSDVEQNSATEPKEKPGEVVEVKADTSAYLGAASEVQTSVAATTFGASSSAPLWRWHHAAADCLACVRTRPPSSHELREAFFAGMENEGGSAADVENGAIGEAVAQLLHHVLFMANPIHIKQSKSALLSLKQRHPDIFRSPCVYSDVCALLARDTYNMLPTRRFLQELFLDTNFDSFYVEPELVMSRHAAPSSAPPSTERH